MSRVTNYWSISAHVQAQSNIISLEHTARMRLSSSIYCNMSHLLLLSLSLLLLLLLYKPSVEIQFVSKE